MDLYRWLRAQWDRAAAVVAAAVGLLTLLLGWLGVSRSTLTTQQIPYLASGALFGLFALGVAATLWLSADLRDEWRKLDDICRRMGAEDLAIGGRAEMGEPAEVFEPVANPDQRQPLDARASLGDPAR